MRDTDAVLDHAAEIDAAVKFGEFLMEQDQWEMTTGRLKELAEECFCGRGDARTAAATGTPTHGERWWIEGVTTVDEHLARARELLSGFSGFPRGDADERVAAALSEAEERGRREERLACRGIAACFGSETAFAIRDAIDARGPVVRP